MINNNEADNKIDNHRSHNQDLSLNTTETRAVPHKEDLSQPLHKVKDPTPAKKMTTIPKTCRTTTEHTLTGLSHKTTDLRHSKRNERLFGGNPNCTFQATNTTMTAPLVPQHIPQILSARKCLRRKNNELRDLEAAELTLRKQRAGLPKPSPPTEGEEPRGNDDDDGLKGENVVTNHGICGALAAAADDEDAAAAANEEDKTLPKFGIAKVEAAGGVVTVGGGGRSVGTVVASN
jgi:hypothetical protein